MRNGKKVDTKEVVLKQDRDYFLIHGKTYYTVDALRRKYGCSDWYVHNKAKEHNIEKISVPGGKVLIADNPEVFTKYYAALKDREDKPKRQADHLKKMQTVPFATLCNNVRILDEKIIEFISMQNDWNSVTNKGISELTYAVRDNNRLLVQILDHLTKEKINDSTSQKE